MKANKPATVRLSADHLRDVLEYDPDTGVFTWRVSRGSRAAGSVAGTSDIYNYRVICIDHVTHKASRLAWLYMTGQFPAGQIDHINHVTHDDRFANLREVSQTTNMRNQTRYTNNKTGVVGVSWHKCTKKWRSEITVNSRHIHLGIFADFDEAVKVRQQAEREYGFHKNHGLKKPRVKRPENMS